MTQYSIVGAYYRPPAKVVLDVLPFGCELSLMPEPTNEYDPNAIKIVVTPGVIPEVEYQDLELALMGHGLSLEEVLEMPEIHLGYIPRQEAAKMKLTGPTLARLAFDVKGKPTVQLD